jgi:hypothetical protein
MSDLTHGTHSGPRDRIVFAVILIAVGIGALALQAAEAKPDLGGWVVLIIGLGFLGAFAFIRLYGFLIPGGIMTGLGAGILVAQSIKLNEEAYGGVIVLGLGLGFLSIWAIGATVRVAGHHFWPLIPGGILAAIGVALLIGGQAVGLLDYWPIVIIGLGVIVLGRAFYEARSHT